MPILVRRLEERIANPRLAMPSRVLAFVERHTTGQLHRVHEPNAPPQRYRCHALRLPSLRALADHLQVDERTLKRQLNALVDAGELRMAHLPHNALLLALDPWPDWALVYLFDQDRALPLHLPPPSTPTPDRTPSPDLNPATPDTTAAVRFDGGSPSPIRNRARAKEHKEDPEEGLYTTTEVAPPPVHPSASEPGVVVPLPVQDAPLASSPPLLAQLPPTPDPPLQHKPPRTPPAPTSPDRAAPTPRRAKASRPAASAKKAPTPRPTPAPEADPLDPDAALDAARAHWGLPEVELIPKPFRMTPEALQQGFLRRRLPWELVRDLAPMLLALLAAEQLHSLMDSIQAASDEPQGIRSLRRFIRAAVRNILCGNTRTPSRSACSSLRPWLFPSNPEPPHSPPPTPTQNLWKNIDFPTFKQMFTRLHESEHIPDSTRNYASMLLVSARQCVQQLHSGLEHSDEDAWEQQLVTVLARLLDDARIPLPQLTEQGELHEEEAAMGEPSDGSG